MGDLTDAAALAGEHRVVDASGGDPADAVASIAALKDRIRELTEELASARAEASAARTELFALDRSAAGRLVRRYRNVVARLAPVGTRRRAVYSRVLGAVGRVCRGRRTAGLDGPEWSVLFDPVWYVARCRDLAAVVDPIGHYERVGIAAGTSPHPCFDPSWYMSQLPEGERDGLNPLEHYLTTGGRAGLSPHPCFDPEYYLARLDPLSAIEAAHAPLVHYLRTPSAWDTATCANFDGAYYRDAEPDVRATGINPLYHYLAHGESEGRRPLPWFAPAWYRKQYENELSLDASPFADYVARASARGLDAAKARRRDEAAASLARFLEGDERVTVPSSADPVVTVAIAVWNQAHFTLECLRSLEFVAVPLRVVVIDNGSSDETEAVLARCDGVEVIRNTENLGFLRATNQVLLAATTPYVLLLNNDCTVRVGSLERAVEVAEETGAGAIAAKIVLPNGLLQEAGSYLWRDGSAQGYLRGAPLTHGPSMHRREVDFGSGAFLLFRTEPVQRLGGLDEAYLPAYYEEVDLCLRLRRAGFPTVYDPGVIVDHVEFGSSRKSDDAIALQIAHRHLVAERFADELGSRPDGGAASDHRMANWCTDDRRGVLLIDDRLPIVSEGSGLPRAAALTAAAAHASGWHVLLAPLVQEPIADWSALDEVTALGVECYPEHGWGALAALLDTQHGRFETVVVSRLHNLQRVLALRDARPDLFDGVRLIYDSEALIAERDRLRAALAGAPWSHATYGAHLAEELEAAAKADTVLAVSAHDAASFIGGGIADVRMVTHSLVTRRDAPGPAGRSGAVFVGRLAEPDSPNVDSVLWYLHSCQPLLSGAALRLVGKTTSVLRGEFAALGGTVVGPVDDLEPEFDAARVFVAPTRFAAGTPIKVITAAAAGIPVVCTSVLCDQLGWTPGVEALVADEPRAFADAVWNLLVDDERWSAIRDAAAARVEADFSQAAFEASVAEALGASR